MFALATFLETDRELVSSMPLKRELTVQDWETLIREIRARVETESTMGQAVTLYSYVIASVQLAHVLNSYLSASALIYYLQTRFPPSPPPTLVHFRMVHL